MREPIFQVGGCQNRFFTEQIFAIDTQFLAKFLHFLRSFSGFQVKFAFRQLIFAVDTQNRENQFPQKLVPMEISSLEDTAGHCIN